MKDLQTLLEISSRGHNHLCPRQILGVRMGLAGSAALGLEPPCMDKRLLVLVETDGCFADGIIAATGCAVGHRTLRVEDYGKAAATFVDTHGGRAIRVAPALDIRARAYIYAAEESRHYFAQMQAYQVMPDEEMFTFNEVRLTTSVEAIISRPGLRVDCEVCGEEIMNEREVVVDGLRVCSACAGHSYYQIPTVVPTFAEHRE